MGETPIITTLILFNIIFIAFIGAIIIFIREYRIKKRKYIEQVHSIDETHKKELLETQMEIQEHTMRHIGREIHDNVGQKLTLASLYMQQLVFENKTLKANTVIMSVNTIIDESLKELRQLSKSLTDDTIKSHSIAQLIEKECRRINDAKLCKVVFCDDYEITHVSYQIKSVIYRITQEFFQNSIKHAKCKNIIATLTNIDNSIHLILEDDGIGFMVQATKSRGIGIQNIKKRTELIGGTVILKSTINEGTKLVLKIPI